MTFFLNQKDVFNLQSIEDIDTEPNELSPHLSARKIFEKGTSPDERVVNAGKMSEL